MEMTRENTIALLLSLRTLITKEKIRKLLDMAENDSTQGQPFPDYIDYRQSRSYQPEDIDESFSVECDSSGKIFLSCSTHRACQRKYDVIYNEHNVSRTYSSEHKDDFISDVFGVMREYLLDCYNNCIRRGKLMTYSSFCNLQKTLALFESLDKGETL